MADAEDVKGGADASTETKAKVWTDDEVQKIIKERDSAKKKVSAKEESDKAALEAKMIEEGKTKELLAQREIELAEARKEAEEAKQYKNAKRDSLLAKLSDDDKEFVDGMSLDKLERFVEKQNQNKPIQSSAPVYKPGGTIPKPKFKNAAENAQWLRSQGLAE